MDARHGYSYSWGHHAVGVTSRARAGTVRPAVAACSIRKIQSAAIPSERPSAMRKRGIASANPSTVRIGPSSSPTCFTNLSPICDDHGVEARPHTT